MQLADFSRLTGGGGGGGAVLVNGAWRKTDELWMLKNYQEAADGDGSQGRGDQVLEKIACFGAYALFVKTVGS
jgi:hypothetical protein